MMPESKPSVTVVGSFAVGLTVRADRFPVKGETLLGRDFDLGPGGKGSNQAVQAARLGANVEFVARLGQDNFGDIGRQLNAQEACGHNPFAFHIGPHHRSRVYRSRWAGR